MWHVCGILKVQEDLVGALAPRCGWSPAPRTPFVGHDPRLGVRSQVLGFAHEELLRMVLDRVRGGGSVGDTNLWIESLSDV